MADTQHSAGERLTAAQAFGRFCAGLEYEALPSDVVERAKHFFIDYMAIALHASTLDSSRPVRGARGRAADPRRRDAVRPTRSGARDLGGPGKRDGCAQHGTG